jgi:hypothetical protein
MIFNFRLLRSALPTLFVVLLPLLVPAWMVAQSSDGGNEKPADPGTNTVQPTPPNPSAAVQPEKQDKRVFGVFPNYRTTDGNVEFQPVTPKQKLLIGLKDSFDWPVYLTGGAFAGLYQLENQNPSFGQGMKGYGRRFGTALGDQIIGNMMTESFFPALLREDPRYFRIGKSRGSVLHRTGYALSRIFITRLDNGGRTFNFSEWVGNASAVAISNAYYPDTRTAGDNIQRLGIACATDAFSQVAKEFWPDVKHALFHRHDANPSAPLLSQSPAH